MEVIEHVFWGAVGILALIGVVCLVVAIAFDHDVQSYWHANK